MKPSPTNCPRCESEQKFITRHRDKEVSNAKWLEAYIKCDMCDYEIILYPTTQDIEKVRKDIYKLSAVGQEQIEVYGAMNGKVSNLLGVLRKERTLLQVELDNLIMEVYDGSSPYRKTI